MGEVEEIGESIKTFTSPVRTQGSTMYKRSNARTDSGSSSVVMFRFQNSLIIAIGSLSLAPAANTKSSWRNSYLSPAALTSKDLH